MKLSKYLLVHEPDALASATERVAKAVSPKSASHAASHSPPTPLTIGLWDLGAWLGGLARLIEAMNRPQKAFVFFEVKATVPAGLISRPERVVPWLSEALGRKLTSLEKGDIKNNLIANDYFELADVIRKDFKLDYLVGITPSMVAQDDGETVFWNLFSTFTDRTVLISTYQLREFAEQTGRPFEAFLAGIIIAQILVARFYSSLGFHDNRGCLFDYNEDRVSIMDKADDLKIEPSCMNTISEPYRPAAQALVDFLRSFGKE